MNNDQIILKGKKIRKDIQESKKTEETPQTQKVNQTAPQK